MIFVVLAGAAALFLVAVVRLVLLRHRRSGAEMAVVEPPGPPEPVYGIPSASASAAVSGPALVSVGSADGAVGFAPRPVSPPHRPVSAGPTVGAPRTAGVRGGAHRRDSDADEIERLRGLHQAGELSDAEFSSLAGRLG